MFLRDYRAAGRSTAQVERVLAVARAFLALTGLVAIYLDPTQPERLQELTYGMLLSYAVYSLLVLSYVQLGGRLTPLRGTALHVMDILWISTLTFVSDGPVSPYFLFFMFAVLGAAYRWGWRETIGTALIIASVFMFQSLVAAVWPEEVLWAPANLDLNRTILRMAYLLATSVLLGYLAEQQKQSRAELAVMADASRQPRVKLGVGGSVAAVTRTLLSTFGARSVVVVIFEEEAGRALKWQIDGSGDDSTHPSARRVELTTAERGAWLFADGGRAWHATRDDTVQGQAWATESDSWPLARRQVQIPPPIIDSRPFTTVTAVNLGLAGEWHGRVYLFDITAATGLPPTLHFLEALAEHVAPALTNVFLMRRLRARAGAAERARVARELHDGTIQALFGVDLRIEAIRRELPAHGRAADDLAAIQGLLQREALALRELMHALRPIELDSGDQLPDALASLVERFRRDSGISARFLTDGNRVTLPPSRAIEVIRIAQEALVNVRKHSHAKSVLVRLTASDGSCSLLVEDDGCGFPFAGRLTARELDERHVGPAMIKERARLAGAHLAVQSSPGAGTRVEVTFGEMPLGEALHA